MRRLTIIIVSVLLLCAVLAVAQICPTTPDGYIRQPRPQGEPANYPPPGEPVCFQTGTNVAGSYISCSMCHPHAYMGWMRGEYQRQKFIMEG